MAQTRYAKAVIDSDAKTGERRTVYLYHRDNGEWVVLTTGYKTVTDTYDSMTEAVEKYLELQGYILTSADGT